MLDLIFCLRLNFSSNQLHTSTTFLFFLNSRTFFSEKFEWSGPETNLRHHAPSLSWPCRLYCLLGFSVFVCFVLCLVLFFPHFRGPMLDAGLPVLVDDSPFIGCFFSLSLSLSFTRPDVVVLWRWICQAQPRGAGDGLGSTAEPTVTGFSFFFWLILFYFPTFSAEWMSVHRWRRDQQLTFC